METLKQKLDKVTLSDTFTVSFDTKAKKAKDTHKVTVEYDFSGVEIEKVLQPAIKKLNIKVQDILRKSFADAEDMAKRLKLKQKFSVEELLKPADRSVDPLVQATRSLDKLDESGTKELIARMKEKGLI